LVLPEQKCLLVEGEDDLYAIAELMEQHISWPNKKEEAPVRIESRGGIENIIDIDTIPLRLKSPGVQILGIIVDANDDFERRWKRLKELCRPTFPTLPDELPATGLLCDNSSGKRLGIWIMPDNQSHGMLETFPPVLVPTKSVELGEFAQASVAEARKKGATYKNKHLDKAHIHTWLAWQDPPGERFGTAILQNWSYPG
jgi:hypothetical protein